MAIDRHMPMLVVDDHRTMTRIVRSQLRQLGYLDVDEANSGTEALTKLCKRRYGLIFSDWYMEGITGLDLLRAVRGDRGLQHIAFIMVSGESRTEHVIAAKRAGVSGYIVKPFDPQMLKAKIEAVFATRGAPLPQRQALSALHADEVSATTPTSDILQQKFPGRFTSS
jgi:two-component system, chemotaxis family, chemotaxis protein CheY